MQGCAAAARPINALTAASRAVSDTACAVGALDLGKAMACVAPAGVEGEFENQFVTTGATFSS